MTEIDLWCSKSISYPEKGLWSGRVSVDEINTRWASHITSIKCWNGQKVRFTFIMDCCDRSIIAWKAGFKMQACDFEFMLQDAMFNHFEVNYHNQTNLSFYMIMVQSTLKNN